MTPAMHAAARGLGIGWYMGLAISAIPAAAEPANLHVMLQGASAANMRSLVEDEGGTLTHYLPIINAVGARLSNKQLERIVAGDQVARYIDDLSVNPEEDAPEEPPCDVGGALELDFTARGFDWRLYNKRAEPAIVSQLSLSWPEKLGRLESLSVAGTALPAQAMALQTAGALQLTELASEVAIAGEARLSARFRGRVSGNHGALQSAIEAELAFSGDCEPTTTITATFTTAGSPRPINCISTGYAGTA